MLSDSGGKIHAAVKLIPSLIIPTVNHIHGDMDGKRGQGYWMPEVRTKDVSFNVTPFEKLDLDRKILLSSILLWHISAINWCYMPAILTISMLYAMGRTSLCG